MMPVIGVAKEEVHVAWMQKSFGSFDIVHSQKNGNNWSVPIQVTNSARKSMFPSMAIDSSGMPHLVWMEGSEERFDIFYSRWNGSRWSKPSNISRTKGASQRPKIAIDSSGIVHVLWYDNTDGFFSLWHVQRSSGQWTDSANTGLVKWYITHDPDLTLTPGLAVDTDGALHVVWVDIDGVRQQLFHSQWNGTAWSKRDRITTSSQRPTELSLAADTSNHLYLVWFDRDDVWFTKSSVDGWLEPMLVSQNSALPDIHIDASEEVYLTWTKGGEILYGRIKGDALSGPVSISRHEKCESPSISTDAAGKPHIVWMDAGTLHSGIHYRCRLATDSP